MAKKKVEKKEDIEKITENINELTSEWNRISTNLYENTSEPTVESEDVEVDDVEFEEVK